MLSVSFVVLIVTLLKSCCCPRATPAASMIPKKTSRLVCFMARTIDPPEANVRPSAAQPAGTDCSAAVEIRRGVAPGRNPTPARDRRARSQRAHRDGTDARAVTAEGRYLAGPKKQKAHSSEWAFKTPAASYSPTELPLQYHRP